MKKILPILFVIFSLVLLYGQTWAGEFWGSKNSDKYHYPDCRWSQKIKPHNLVIFETPEKALKAGYVPCKVCRPPVASRSEMNLNNYTNYVLSLEGDSAERRGCCSWHGGVCGCNNDGRVICCDGTLSPTCTCW
ncbi:MAG: Ada metal-binding domain-containing protein [Nitrospirota bacterium]